ncbi:hypothetical protein PEG84_09815, partial [Lactococcus lactis]|uniref:hypothetical protein n=1 Tax=Lactococcus lactis TaxID=1358 RepID=UPI0022E5F546
NKNSSSSSVKFEEFPISFIILYSYALINAFNLPYFLKQNVTDYNNILALFNQKYKHLCLKKSP